MKKIHIQAFSVLFPLTITMLLGACSGDGGLSSVSGRLCENNVEPVLMKADKSKLEVELDFDSLTDKAAKGIYRYQGATLFYVSKDDVRIQMQDVLQTEGRAKGTFKNEVVCLRNAYPGMPSFNVNVEGIRNMEVDGTGKPPVIDTMDYTLGSLSNKIVHKSTVASRGKIESPKDFYAGQKFTEVHVVRLTSRLFEIRAKGMTEDGGTYTLGIKYRKRDFPDEAAPAKK